MTVHKYLTVWCDGCSEWSWVAAETKSDARNEVKAIGWVYRNKKDLCPRCMASEKRSQNVVD